MRFGSVNLEDYLPEGFSGGYGIVGLLAALFPVVHTIVLYFFDVNITALLTGLLGGTSIVGAGASLVGLGAGAALLQQLWHDYFLALYHKYFSVSLEIPNHDPAYFWFMNWVHDQRMKNPRHLSVETNFIRSVTKGYVRKFDFCPSVGTHYFRFKDKKFEIERMREDRAANQYGERLESLVLTTRGKDTTMFTEMLTEMDKFMTAKYAANTMIYTTMKGEWNYASQNQKMKRPLTSVILEDGVSEAMVADIQDFLDSSAWYSEFGVPYRRGYLLYGPPGTGKTSFITAVAGHFSLNVCLLNLSDKSLTDESLNQLLIDAPLSSIVLLEDVDAAFGSREDEKSSGKVTAAEEEDAKSGNGGGPTAHAGLNRLTFSGLLNALDGIASSEGRILFMTTNHVDNLDPALVRPGRVDYRQEIGFASESQVARMFNRFDKSAVEDVAKRFVRAIFDHPKYASLSKNLQGLSLAQLQGLFLKHKYKPGDVFNGIPTLFDDGKTDKRDEEIESGNPYEHFGKKLFGRFCR